MSGLSGAAAVLNALLEARTGQRMSEDRAWRADIALKPLLREYGVATPDELVSLMLSGREPGAADRIVDMLLNGETSFFRDPAVFDMVMNAVAVAEAEGRRPRIWSAGCSTGQEPLSLAMLLAERAQATGAPVPEIIATDVSATAIARARAGRFSQFEIQRGLPIRRTVTWFETTASGDWIARPDLLKLVTLRRMNLAVSNWDVGQFDIVLCRNVLLYFGAELKTAVFGRLAKVVRPGGLLVLGAGETVVGQTRDFEPSRRFRGLYDVAGSATGRAAA